ncbi:MAG TPA: maleylpyruvate isomerase N-terminal domain-containing protein, partial [Acidimicrobiales bacterium]|nr:maleylpyruvate isomerase N-terminal domain-containing protein [Acidimicrobiales bacterium]
ETVVATPVDPASTWLSDAAAYYRVALGWGGAHAGIAQRAVDGAHALADDPAGGVRAAAERVGALVAATPDVREVQHLAGRLAFAEYLRTRVLELVLHGVDLQLALGWPADAPREAARVSAALVVELAERADPLGVACALAGRPVPGGCNVLS